MKAKELIEMIKNFGDKKVYFGNKNVIEAQIREEGIWLLTEFDKVFTDIEEAILDLDKQEKKKSKKRSSKSKQ